MKRWLILFGILALVTIGIIVIVAHWRHARVIAAINEEMPYRNDPGPTEILVSEVIENGKYWNERCLVVKRFSGGYALACVIRDPKDESSKWHLREFTGRIGGTEGTFELLPPLFGYECYETAPSDDEIAAFLKLYMWASDLRARESWHTDEDRIVWEEPKLVKGTVHRKAWNEMLDREPPMALFPEFAGKLVIE